MARTLSDEQRARYNEDGFLCSLPWLDHLVRHPAVLAAVEDLIGPDLLVYHLTMWINGYARSSAGRR